MNEEPIRPFQKFPLNPFHPSILIVLNAVGMRAQAQAGIALVVGVDRLLDMVRTCVNVTCQLVGVGYVARAEGELVGDNTLRPGSDS